MRNKRDYHLEEPTWCPGCGIFALFDALKKTAAAMDLDPEQMVVVTGIGCHGRLSNYFKAYGFHGLHGRVLPVAAGIKISNPGLQVLGVSGDGDAYSIGLNHFIHAVRKNINLTYLVVDNRIYALTLGQTSPTSSLGFVSKSTPYGSKQVPLDGVRMALAAGGTFLARGFSGQSSHLAALIERGMNHKGFALIEVLSPCVTQNKSYSYEWYRENTYLLEDDSSYDPLDRNLAWEKLNADGKIPVGLIYEERRPSYEELVLPKKEKPLVFNDLKIDVPKFENNLQKFR